MDGGAADEKGSGMIWLAVIALAAAVLLVLAFVLRAPRAGWEAIGAALVLALAGYALQGQPQLPASPHARDAGSADTGAFLVSERVLLAGGIANGDKPLVIADGYVRHGDYAGGVAMLDAAVEKNPNDGEVWLALGNALVGHAQGLLTPAARYAYARAAAAEPQAPGPPFFLGLALAGSGQVPQARALWADTLAHAPANAPWRGELAERLARLDRLIGQIQSQPQGPN